MSFHSGLGIPVAVKILKPHLIEEDPEFLERFIQEGRLAVSLHHKNIIRVFDAGKAGESYYLVMELLEGNDALHILDTEGCFSIERTIEIGCAVADALTEAHEHGVIHRDIKPDNIMITSEGKIKLADLGLAKKLGDEFSSTMIGSAIGTPNYMSPEQALNSRDADARSDIYSLGSTLYHMLTGTLPFDGESIMAVMMKHANEPLDHPQERKESLPDNICSVIIKMMDKDPTNRYQTCEEVLTALNTIRYAPTESERPKTNVLKTKKFKKPSKKIEEVKKQKKEPATKTKKKKTAFITGIILGVLFPLLFILLNSSPEKATNNIKEQVKVPAKQKAVNKEKPPAKTQSKEQVKSIDLLSTVKISKNQSAHVFFKNGVLEIIPRNSFAYAPFSGIHGNCRLKLEYKLLKPNSYGKIGLFRNSTQTTNLVFSTPDHKKQFTGNIQIKNGTDPNYEYINALKVKKRNEKNIGQWNTLDIILDENKITVSVNETEVSTYTADYSEGAIVILAHNNAHLFIRKFELIPLK